jgi:ACT domain-containing protein
MTREEMIMQMTRIVYSRLGAGADPRVVEDLVIDLARSLSSGMDVSRTVSSSSRVVVSAFGTSKPGIVAAITSELAEARYDIVDMNQTVVQGKFAMVLIAEVAADSRDLSALRQGLKDVGEEMGIQVYTQREDLFHAMHRV